MARLFCTVVAIPAMMLGTVACEAHVLVYRQSLSGTFTREDALGRFRNSTQPSGMSRLWLFDLDTDCWIESSTGGTSFESITLDERSKTAKKFFHAGDVGEGIGEHRVVHKFEFYSNNRKFYYFYFQTENLGQWGFDTGSIAAHGGCRLNANIGGGRTSSVPLNFTAFIKRGDGQTFKSGVLFYKYDSTITVAVNEYLKRSAIQSAKGSGVSLSIPAATSWLISDYLPKNGYVQVSAP